MIGPPRTLSDDAAVGESITAIRIDDPVGSVRVIATAGTSGASLERTLRYRGADRRFDATHSVEGDTLVLGGCGRNCSASYVLEVPEGVDVTGRTSDGAIELTGVGEVEVATSNGRIELDGVSGGVDVETSNGRIAGRGLEGDGIRASTSNGAIELTLGVAQDVVASTSNGAIDVTVPRGAGFSIETETSNGRVEIDVDEDRDGDHHLDLRTSNGSIRVVEGG
ncbi:hypothetical protein GCM10025870_21750 [Agromyces marinus]|uniref:DUF4097 domain-containing protein n=1 Tax=Agromyces marinus TaxID=1389020 RepID=A0ABN6YCJ2_9MICO|nr:hypothetical protein GCM10025870_21750 [Agromyces marinus]